MTMHRQRRTAFRVAVESLVASAALALPTWVAYRLHTRVVTIALAYLALLVLVSLRGSLVTAIVVGIAATLSLDYFFLPPALGFMPTEPRDLVAVTTFAAAAVVVARLVRALRASQARWKNVFENNPAMYFIVDEAGKILSVNRTGAQQLGHTVDELQGQPVLNVFLEEDKAAARQHVERCLAHFGESMSWELRKVRKDGTMLWVRETARAVRIDRDALVVLMAGEDITAQKEARDRLRENESRLRWQASLIDLSHEAIFVCDLNSVIIYWNRGAERLYGWSREEAVGQVTHELLRTEFPEPLDDINATLLRTGSWDGQLVHRKRDGTPIVVAGRWSLQRNAHGEPAGILKTNNDVTERKRAEESLRTAQAELARAGTLTTLGQLAGSIAHELRQPLAAIAMNGSAALRWLNRESPDIGEAREAASRVVREAHRADEVIRGLRALMSKSELQRQPLDINDAVHEVLELARGELHRNDVLVQTDLDPALPPSLGDRVQLQQVVLNLVLNAIEAMAPLADRPKVLTVRTARTDTRELVVAIEDTGTGLDPATADRIFDQFFTTKPNGLGMGLSISRSIVEAHGGQLSVSVRSPQGTSFRFTVPAMAAAASTAPPTEVQGVAGSNPAGVTTYRDRAQT